MNGIEGLAMPLCTALNCEPGDRPHALQSLSVKSCKTLRAFWLGLEPLPQPGLHEQDPQQPPVLPPPRRLLTPLSGASRKLPEASSALVHRIFNAIATFLRCAMEPSPLHWTYLCHDTKC